MYPTEKQPAFGIFVKNFIDSFHSSKIFNIKTIAVIKGRKQGMINKLVSYMMLYFKILTKGIFYKYDIIYVHYFKYTIIPSYLIKIIKPNLKLIYNFHGSDIIDEKTHNMKINRLKYNILKSSNAIIVPSQYFNSLITRNFPTLAQKIFISPSGGINEKIFFKKKAQINSETLQIGYVGRIDYGKGIDTLLKAVDILNNESINFKCNIVGSGALEEQIKCNMPESIKSKVKFHGAQPQYKLNDYYNSFDVFVFPTKRLSESLGLVGIESLACGTPVIGSNIGEIRYYIKEGYNGFLFNPNDHLMLAQKIIKYKRLSRKERFNLSANAVASSKKYYSKEVHENIESFLKKL
jgi:L-malate glycosyltransferase